MLRKLIVAVSVIAVALGVAAPAQASGGHSGGDKSYVLAAWAMPTWANGTAASWPQTLVTSKKVTSTSLDQLDAELNAIGYGCYQIDLYNDSATTAALLNYGKLTAPSTPKAEDLARTGINAGWKFLRVGNSCDQPAKPADKVTYTDWKDGTWACNDTEVTQTRTKTVTPYKWKDGKWVKDSSNATVTTETKQRTLKNSELKKCYVIVAWDMGGWINGSTAVWPQKYVTSEKQTTPNLGALDDDLNAIGYGCYQIDIYYDDATTTSLINGKVLYGPNNPTEHLIAGGSGTAWKFLKVGNSCNPPKPAGLHGTDPLPPVQECVTPKNGTATLTNYAKDWTQEYVWNATSKKWELGAKVYGDKYPTGTQTVDDATCIPQKPHGIDGKDKFPPTQECVVPGNGTATVTWTAKNWKQDYVWNANQHKWVLGDKVYGDAYVWKSKVVDDATCIPTKPTGFSGTVKFPPTQVCVVPSNGTATVTWTAKDWTQNYTWNAYKHKWVLGDKVYGAVYVDKTQVVDDYTCIPHQPHKLQGKDKFPPTQECVVPNNGTAKVKYTAQDWKQSYTWSWDSHSWVLGDKVYGDVYVYKTQVVDDESCIPTQPTGYIGSEPQEPTHECQVPFEGIQIDNFWARNWTQDYVWNATAHKWELGEKVFGEPYITDTQLVDVLDCVPDKPEGLSGTESVEPTHECLVPADGTATQTTYAKNWTQDWSWDFGTHAWVLGDQVFTEPYETGTSTIEAEDCTAPTLTATLTPMCVNNVPLVDWTATLTDPNGLSEQNDHVVFTFLNTKDATGDWSTSDLPLAATDTAGEFSGSGTFAWPFATFTGSIPDSLVGTGWPGWTQDSEGVWHGPSLSNGGWTLGGVNVLANVNPEYTVTGVMYPDTKFPCTPPTVELHNEEDAPPATAVVAEAQFAG